MPIVRRRSSASARCPASIWTKPFSTSSSRSFGPGQVAEDPDPLAHQLARGADPLDVLGVARLVAVGEVEPEDVGTGRDQALEDLRRPCEAGPIVATILVRRWSASRSLGGFASPGLISSGRGRAGVAALPWVGRRGELAGAGVVGLGVGVRSRARAAGCRGGARARWRRRARPPPRAWQRNHCPAGEQLELEEVPHRGSTARIAGVERAERGDHREHVALDRDVLAAGTALEQEDESEAEHDQRRRRRGAALVQGAAEDPVDERRTRAASRSPIPTPAGTANAASARSRRPR